METEAQHVLNVTSHAMLEIKEHGTGALHE
jgi:amidase